MNGLQLIGALLLGLAFGAIVAALVARRTRRADVRELEAYLDGWFDAKRDQVDAKAAAATRARAGWSTVYDKLAERRNAYWDLRSASEVTTQQLQRLIDLISDQALVYDTDGRLLFASADLRALACALVGAPGEGAADTPTEIEAVNALVASHPELRKLIERGLSGPPPPPAEIALRQGAAEHRYVAVLHRIPGSGSREGLLALLKPLDVVQEMRRAGERHLALEHLNLAAELLAHRLRNPLNSIVLLIEVMRRQAARGAAPATDGQLDGIEAEVAKLEATLQRFLDAVRRPGRSVETLDLATVIEGVAELLYPIAREAGLLVRQELHVPSAPVRADPVEVARALLGPALAGVRVGRSGETLKFRLDSDRREHVVSIEVPNLVGGSIELAVAEELAARNGGEMTEEGGQPARLTFRFPSADS